MTAPHPAKWSDPILDALRSLNLGGPAVDPFAGVGIGRLSDALGFDVVGLEIEPDWADSDPRTIVGNALRPPFRPRSFRTGVTSCTYGNRMADHHNAQERCRPCRGHGAVGVEEGGVWFTTGDPCPKCGGLGRRAYKRLTYRHQIGHDLHPENSGAMPWGPAYREFHAAAWTALDGLLVTGPKARLVVNVKDHWKTMGKGEDKRQEVQPVTSWHVETIEGLGWRVTQWIKVPVVGMKMGANRDVRDDFESVVVFERAA